MNKELLLETKALTKVYEETGERLEILRGIDFQIYTGEYLVLTGSSGSGKSTFLNMVGALDKPTSGSILFKGKDLSKMNERERNFFHKKNVGFVFQFHHLLSEFSDRKSVV